MSGTKGITSGHIAVLVVIVVALFALSQCVKPTDCPEGDCATTLPTSSPPTPTKFVTIPPPEPPTIPPEPLATPVFYLFDPDLNHANPVSIRLPDAPTSELSPKLPNVYFLFVVQRKSVSKQPGKENWQIEFPASWQFAPTELRIPTQIFSPDINRQEMFMVVGRANELADAMNQCYFRQGCGKQEAILRGDASFIIEPILIAQPTESHLSMIVIWYDQAILTAKATIWVYGDAAHSQFGLPALASYPPTNMLNPSPSLAQLEWNANQETFVRVRLLRWYPHKQTYEED